MEFYDKAIQIRERLVMIEGRTELSDDLAKTYANKANALSDLGKHRAAVDFYDKAIEIYERLVVKERPHGAIQLSCRRLHEQGECVGGIRRLSRGGGFL